MADGENLATYSYLPWVRQGIAAKIQNVDLLESATPAPERASLDVSVRLVVDDIPGKSVTRTVKIAGPGDVIGINPRVIVRTEPLAHVTNFEPNFLPFIEFYDEDFPWRYTPASAAPGSRLRPWIALAVLEEVVEFQDVAVPPGPLPAIEIVAPFEKVFPSAKQMWAWAHVHVSRSIFSSADGEKFVSADGNKLASNLGAVLEVNPDLALSRLICPRKLKPLTAYHAFLIPSFETGRLAGLGCATDSVDGLAPSWPATPPLFPYFYRWFFHTSERGDFEFLVNLLKRRKAGPDIGRRSMDMQNPGFRVPGMSDGPFEESVMGLEGALKSPEMSPLPKIWPPASTDDFPPFLTTLQRQVNLQAELLTPPPAPRDEPVISPPLYGRWHAMQDSLIAGDKGWVNALNADPRTRVAAGLGAKIVQANQENFVQRAWQQLEDVLRANQKIREAQFALSVGHRVHTRFLVPLSAFQQVAVTQPMHGHVLHSEGNTILRRVRTSKLPVAALSPTFRRIIRPRGRMMRKVLQAQDLPHPFEIIRLINSGRITAARPKRQLGHECTLPHDLEVDTVGTFPTSGVRCHFVVTRSDKSFQPNVGDICSTGAPSQEAVNFGEAVRALQIRLKSRVRELPPRTPLDVENTPTKPGTAEEIVKAINPVRTVPGRMHSVVPELKMITDRYQSPPVTIVPAMAHPDFADPMYRPLRDISSELLVPNLGLIGFNTLTLLVTNSTFIEAYMAGLNHEMARELLWREYPTDQRGSYFRQFWDVGDLTNHNGTDSKTLENERRDILPLDTWEPGSPLGSHPCRDIPAGNESDDPDGTTPKEDRLVFAVRGELLKRYPTGVIYAHRAMWAVDGDTGNQIRVLDTSVDPAKIQEPVFKAEIEPDVRFLGFNLVPSVASGDPDPSVGNAGWYFIIQERPGEPRFGMDVTAAGALTTWDQLSWEHLPDAQNVTFIDACADLVLTDDDAPDAEIIWGTNAAHMAYILLQKPVIVAVHASTMLEESADG